MKTKLNLVDVIVIITLATVLLPVVTNKLPFGLHSFRFLWGPLTVLSIIISRPSVLIKGPLKYILLYGLIALGILQYTLWKHLGEWERHLYFSEFIAMVVATAIWSYYWQTKEYKKFARIGIWALFFVLITLITTNIALYYDPLVVRTAASGEFTPQQLRLVELYGTANYGYAQSVVFLIPLFVYYIKTRQKLIFSVPFLIVILLFLIISIARFQVFANFMVAIVIILASLMGIWNRRTAIKTIVLGSLLFVFTPADMSVRALFKIQQYFKPESEIYGKLVDAALAVEMRDIEAGSAFQARAGRYPMLLDALLENPIKGYASHKSTDNIFVGFHVWWMYRLALWGVPGFLFFIYVLKKLFTRIGSVFTKNEIRYYYFLCILSFILMGLTKNILGHAPWIMLIVVIPGLFLSAELKNKHRLSTI